MENPEKQHTDSGGVEGSATSSRPAAVPKVSPPVGPEFCMRLRTGKMTSVGGPSDVPLEGVDTVHSSPLPKVGSPAVTSPQAPYVQPSLTGEWRNIAILVTLYFLQGALGLPV